MQPPASLSTAFKMIVTASALLAFFIIPNLAHAANLGTITQVTTGGQIITNGATVSVDSIGSLSNYWDIQFVWPGSFSPGSASAWAVFKGSFGNLDGGTAVSGQNYYTQSEVIAQGLNYANKQYALPPLGSAGLTSGTYTVVVASVGGFSEYPNFVSWFQSGGVTGAEPGQYMTMTFIYDATSHTVELQDAINSVTVSGRTITAGEQVYRKEVGSPNPVTDNHWTFNFDWPNFVANQQALLMVFRGTYGNLEGGAPVLSINYSAQLQAWAEGHNEFGKFFGTPALNDIATEPGTYTVMLAERDSKYLAQGIDQQALWFATGGTQGIAPKKYSTLTFEFKGDDPYPVIIVPGILGSAQDVNGNWVLDPITHVYDNLYETLDQNSYTPGYDLFTFPYDWRVSNVETATLLQAKINEVQSVCHCKKVDLVAHSMGGLVSRQYIQSAAYESDVNKMIFLGTPHLGSPKSYLMYEGGEVTGGLEDFAFDLYLEHLASEAGFDDPFEYIHLGHISSIQELLPVYDYTYGPVLETYPNGYPRNVFLEGLDSGVDSLAMKGVDVTNIVGRLVGEETLVSLNVHQSSRLPRWVHGEPIGFYSGNKELGLNYGEGDGTVPFSSANLFPADLILDSSHTALPTSAEGEVLTKLTGRAASYLANRSLVSRLLMFRIFSPADLTVIDPQGRRVGRDGSGEVNEIPDAYYTGFNTNTEFIVIPNPLDGEYVVQTVGTGVGGEYTVATNYVTETGSVQEEYTGTIAPNEVVEKVAELESSSPDPLAIQGTDMEAPVINISSPLAQSYLHSDTIQLTFAVIDADSGVATATASWDSVATTTNSINLFFQALGTHQFVVNATDVAGNATSSVIQINVITSPESTRLDILKAFSLGWIKKANIKDTLIDKVDRAIKIEKKIELLEEKLPGKPKVIRRIEKLEARLDKVLGVKVINELDTQLGKGNITQQAYNIIKADVQWLLSQP